MKLISKILALLVIGLSLTVIAVLLATFRPSFLHFARTNPTSDTTPIQIPKDPDKPAFSANPTSGPYPVTVIFLIEGAAGRNMRNILIVYGDGNASGVMESRPCPSLVCNFTAKHIYRSPGTYTATLETGPASGVVGTATITVLR